MKLNLLKQQPDIGLTKAVLKLLSRIYATSWKYKLSQNKLHGCKERKKRNSADVNFDLSAEILHLFFYKELEMEFVSRYSL